MLKRGVLRQVYGPAQIDYVMVSCRWATSAHKCSVKWGVICQRWGRRYDHDLVSCVWVCRAFSPRKRDKQIDYTRLMAKDGDELRERFDARVKQHLMATYCDTAVASASLERLTKCVHHDYGSAGDAARQTAPYSEEALREQPCKATV